MRPYTEENNELSKNLRKEMEAQRRQVTSKPSTTSTKKRPFGSDLTGSVRGSEDRGSAVPSAPRGTKRGREIEGIDKVCLPDSSPEPILRCSPLAPQSTFQLPQLSKPTFRLNLI